MDGEGRMSRKRFTAEQIIGLLREADVKLSQGKNAGQVSRDRIIQVLWLNDGSCIRLRPQRKNHVWSYETDPHSHVTTSFLVGLSSGKTVQLERDSPSFTNTLVNFRPLRSPVTNEN
jgi:hypothetical protein